MHQEYSERLSIPVVVLVEADLKVGVDWEEVTQLVFARAEQYGAHQEDGLCEHYAVQFPGEPAELYAYEPLRRKIKGLILTRSA